MTTLLCIDDLEKFQDTLWNIVVSTRCTGMYRGLVLIDIVPLCKNKWDDKGQAIPMRCNCLREEEPVGCSEDLRLGEEIYGRAEPM